MTKPCTRPSRNEDSAAPRQHLLICTGAKPIHPVHFPPKLRATKAMPRIEVTFSPFSREFLTKLSKSLKTLSEETGPILDCCFYLPVFMSLNDPVHERTCIPCGWSVSRYVNWCQKTSLYRTYLHVRWCSKHLFSARQKNARTPAQARLCDGAAVCLPCKPVKPILQFEFCPRSHQNPRQPMTPS